MGRQEPGGIVGAIVRARLGVATVAAAYLLGVLAGAIMAHTGNRFALSYRDRMVSQAIKTSPILHADGSGKPLVAAALDTAGNAAGGIGGVISGYCLPIGYAIAVYRGWIGGIVSVDWRHRSRLAIDNGAAYYVTVMLLQLIPFSLTGGAGINIGLAAFTTLTPYKRTKWSYPPRRAVLDAAILFAVSLPIFAIASTVEFLWKS